MSYFPTLRMGLPWGTVVGVIDKERPNYGLIGVVKPAFGKARKIPDGWVWVEFESSHPDGGKYACEYAPESLVSILSLGAKAFKEMIGEGES